MKLDVLAIGVHPDDVELGAGATVAKLCSEGYKVGILDLTSGQLGTRGTPELRIKEAENAAKILGVQTRVNLEMQDGFFKNDAAHQLQIIEQIRRFQPRIVLLNAPSDRHPDHGRAAQLEIEACFYAGLRKIESTWKGVQQEAFRPTQLYHYIQFNNLEPDFISDVSGFVETKMKAILAFESQFYKENSDEPETVLTSQSFLDATRFRMTDYGRLIGTEAGEGFITHNKLGVSNLMDLI